jgi:diguanylate cyclase (GGDEF)-like protein/PAS domain S-box-containing protein
LIKFISLNPIERNSLLILLVWTGIFTFSYVTSINYEKQIVHQLAINEIQSNFKDIDTFRAWIARQGGVYVPVSEHLKPNPVIEHLPDRDVNTTSGKQLTLINTPYLLKQLAVANPSSFNAQMTGLNPINPANMADEWERKALNSIIDGKEEVCEIVDYKNEQHMRLIKPSIYEEKCQSCHIEKQYKNGDVVGGLSVSIPMQPYFNKSSMIIKKLSITHASLWFLGLAGILFVYRNQKKHEHKRKLNEDSLRQSSVAFNNLNEGLIITDSNMMAIAVNNAFSKITGYNKDDLIGKNPTSMNINNFAEEQNIKLLTSLEDVGVWQGEIEFISKNNTISPIRLSINTVHDNDDNITNYIFVYSDIRERKNFEKTLEHLAQHDHLTDLPNRMLLHDRLNQSIIQAERNNRKIAVLFLDLDHFKNINDSMGHNTGDTVLIQAAQRLKKALRKGDTLARHGGDEFIVVMEGFDSKNDVSILCKKLLNHISPEFLVNGEKYFLGVSIGISIYPEHGNTVSDLISKADIAMYKAKSDGRNDYKFYTPDLNTNILDRMKIDTDLHNAITNDEFVLHYQPQISIENNEIIGVECLVRWEHPDQGLIYPDNFIPAAEEIDLMVPIGEIIINKACAQMHEWFSKGIDIGIMAVNISGKQINNSKLLDHVTKALEKYSIPSNRLELEVTENFIMKQGEQSINSLEVLRDSSVHISIDDFGTGYSSLNYLKKLPINKIKIDRSFIEGIPSDPHDKAIINAVIAIGRSLNYKVIAEGVENAEQLKFLKENGCDEYQGYYCSKPLAAKDFELMLRDNIERAHESINLILNSEYP